MNPSAALGRRLLIASALAMTFGQGAADWNRSHTFGPGYGPHARWHGVNEVVSAALDGGLMLWLLTRTGPRERRLATTVAALLPVVRYGPSNVTLAVPGASPYAEGARRTRLLGLPAALVAQDTVIALAAAGYWLQRRSGALRRR
ncbi:hypothetical protein SAMN05444365_106102 [Micromonospora pattaloongensis]|uniref:Uncharacterized protein n=1 Tax=Micromonospora pattaloongensis TaxID=405436 RepID=A0A1H3QTN6_9ACTN|nr:hypothetical protein [Micromonospora pattaloongensis]SDZ16375.1 hypothetical protein SAMN05444365_106102 [Micromonospora pattaloongensis]